jgi:rubrerythrin
MVKMTTETTQTTQSSYTTTSMTAEKHEIKATTMSLNDILEAFRKEFEDEVQGSNQYLDMAIAADEMNRPRLCQDLCAMGHDEYTHAKFIWMTLDEHDVSLPQNQLDEFKALEARIHKLFR